MTKVSLAAIAATVTCVLMACGGTEDGRDYREADAGTGGSVADAGAKEDASQLDGDGTGGGSSGGGSDSTGGGGAGSGSGNGSSGGTATCEPGGSCGGLYYCNDNCYSDKCCQLTCNCSDPSGQTGSLECSLTSCTN